MMTYRHSAYNVITGQIINTERSNHLKRVVAMEKKVDKELYGMSGQWRFSHDFGKSWNEKGLPVR